jgi:hypothetical protein
MYNTYQNRVATARDSYNRAVLNYNNAIKDAQLQNNAALAEIAYNALQQQLELSLQGFQYKNQLILDQANKKIEIDNIYYNRYQDVLNQMNTENALKEDIRQFEARLDFDEAENAKNRAWESTENEKERAWKSKESEIQREFEAKENALDRQFQEDMAALEQKYELELLDAKTKKEKELLKEEYEYAKKERQEKLANDKALIKYEYEIANKYSKSSSGSSGGSAKIGGSGNKSSGNKKSNSNTKPKILNYIEAAQTNKYKQISTKQITNLGYGPISTDFLAFLVSSGRVIYSEKNGTVKNANGKKPTQKQIEAARQAYQKAK